MSVCNMLDTIHVSFKKCIEAYVPEDLHKHFTFGEDIITVDRRANKIQMYGDHVSFATCLLEFSSFPGATEIFSVEIAETFDSDAHKYHYKHDILSHLSVLTPIDSFEDDAASLILSIVRFYLTAKSLELDDNLVPFHSNLFQELEKKLETISSPNSNLHMTMEEAFKELKLRLPVNSKDPEYTSIRKALNKYEKMSTLRRKPYHVFVFFVKIVLREFENFIKNYPEWNQKNPVVRLFEDGKDQFVLVHEILNKMEEAKMDVSGIKEQIEMMDQLETIDFKELKSQYPTEIFKNVHFAETSIQRTKYRSLYIPYSKGEHCILKLDFLLEILKEAITVKSVFQCVNQKNIKTVFGLFGEFVEELSKTVNKSRFIDIKDCQKLRVSFFEKLQNLLGESLKKTKNIRTVGPKGFKLEDLLNEVRYLGLQSAFPDLLEICKEHFLDLCDGKNSKELTTFDMYFILETLQVSLIIGIPKIAIFIHGLKACAQIHLNCDQCKGNLNEAPEGVKTSSSSESDDRENEKKNKKREKRKRQAEKKKLVKGEAQPVVQQEEVVKSSETEEKEKDQTEVSSDETASEDVTTSSESNSDGVEKKTKKQEKRKRQTEKKKSARAESQSTENYDVSSSDSESKVCEKCYRTSQKCMEANEKFRQEKIKNKALKKELKTVSTELELAKQREMEKDEEIRILKEKLAASEEIVAEFQNREELEVDPIDESPEVLPTSEASDSRTNMMEVLIKLLDMKDALPEHKKEATGLAEELLSKTTQKKYHDLVESEMVKFRSDYSVYYQLVEEHIDWIRKNPNERLDLLRLLPHYPELSQEFHKAYDNVVNKKELDDQECLICMESMEEETGTVKCNSCRRRYHMSCAWDWSIVKNECAVCKKEIEFPVE